MAETDILPIWPLLASGLALLVPWGIALVSMGALHAPAARQAALATLVAFVLAVVGYLLVGFALHYGGIGLVVEHPHLDALVLEWSALSADWGETWGMAGLAGFGLVGVHGVGLMLFFSALPWAMVAALLPMLALRGRAPSVVVALLGLLTAMVFYPMLGNWIQGGGWLANLGYNVGWGHGFVDFGGSAAFLIGGGVALAGMLAFLRRQPRPADPAELPPVHLPLLAMLGAGLVLVGSAGWLFASPLIDAATLDPARTALNALIAAAGGGLLPILYTWFVAGQPDAGLGARGVAAGWVAGLAAAPFLTPLAALIVGAAAGLLMVLTTYLIDHRLRWHDPAGILATLGVPALWGMVALGLFADGAAGAGYNGIGAEQYLGVSGQGVTGLWPAAGFASAGSEQLLAQAVGGLLIFLLAFLLTLALAVPLALIIRAWKRTPDREPDTSDAPATNDIE